jgi:hypothetical protein
MRWIRSVLAVGIGLVVAFVGFLAVGFALSPFISAWADQHRGGNDGLTPGAEAVVDAYFAIVVFCVFVIGGLTASMLASTARRRHALCVGLAMASATTIFWVQEMNSNPLGQTSADMLSSAVWFMTAFAIMPVLGSTVGGWLGERLARRLALGELARREDVA